MPRVYVGGREVDVPQNWTGNVSVDQIRQAAGVPRGRMLILQRPTGENVIMPARGRIEVDPYDHFMDAPRAKRGYGMNIQILENDVRELSYKYRVELDDDYRRLVVSNFSLPPGYNRSIVPVLLKIPQDYPESPPGVGSSQVYLPGGLRFRGRRPKDYHEKSDSDDDWCWWCYEWIKWDLCRDNLITFFELLRAHMTNPK